MAFRGVSYYRVATQTDSPPAGVVDLIDGSSGTGGSSPSLASSTSAATIYQIKPQVGNANFTSATAASTQLANNLGWQVPVVSGMATSSTTSRVVTTAQAFHFDSRTTNALGTTTSFGVVYAVYKRSAAGALTLLGKATSSTLTGGLTATSGTFPANFTPSSDVAFGNGETLYVEVYVTVSQASVTAGSMTLIIDAPWTITGGSGNGMAFRYATPAADTASASDSLSRVLTRVRSTADTVTGSDSAQRGLQMTRATADTASASDSLARTLIVTRGTADNIGPSGGASDYPSAGGTKAIAGVVYDATGTVRQAGATCRLLRDSDEFLCGTVTTGADGSYSFVRGNADPNTYHVEVYVGSALHGLSDRGLVPS